MSFSSSLRNFSASMLRLPLKWLVKELRAPTDPAQEYDLSKQDHVIYILRTKSSSSIQLLKRQASATNLPEASALDHDLAIPNSGSCLFINARPSWFSRNRTLTSHKQALEKLLQAQQDSPNKNYKLVPVSFFWGRNAGKEKSLIRYFISNIEEAGRFGKLLIILFQGRQCMIQYGQPIELNSKELSPQLGHSKNAQKLSRILRIHFSRQWVAAMGPRTEYRRDMARGIAASDTVQEAIAREVSKSKKSKEELTKEALKYANEIGANYSPRTIRMMSGTLKKLWHKIYSGIEVHNLKPVRELAKNSEIIYVPCHRSHTDYLLLSHQLYHEGLVPPHIAAGINLNFWPVGSILRRGGAFFLRRSFKGNRLYAAVFNEYLFRLINKGVPVEYFQEGGRSRTGRLLTPKTGMLAMTVQSHLRGVRKPIVFVPVYIGYERMFEGKSYVGELRGGAKKQESFGQLLGIRKALKRFYGKVYLNFGQPLPLTEFLEEQNIDWKADAEANNLRPDWLSTQVVELGDEINRRINASVSLNSVCLVSLALLGTPRQALDKNELIAQLDTLLILAKAAPYSDKINISSDTGTQLLDNALKLGMVHELKDPTGNIISIEGDEAVLSTYYSNNILHIFAISSLIGAIFQRHNKLSQTEISSFVKSIYPFLQSELYIHWQSDQLEPRITVLLNTMLELGLLESQQEDGQTLYCAPNTNRSQWSRLMLLAQAVQPALQRYAISLTLLDGLHVEKSLSRGELEKESQKLAQRISALYGINAPEFSDKHLFKNQVKVLREQEMLEFAGDGGLRASEQGSELFEQILSLLSIPVQQGLLQASRSLKQVGKSSSEE